MRPRSGNNSRSNRGPNFNSSPTLESRLDPRSNSRVESWIKGQDRDSGPWSMSNVRSQVRVGSHVLARGRELSLRSGSGVRVGGQGQDRESVPKSGSEVMVASL